MALRKVLVTKVDGLLEEISAVDGAYLFVVSGQGSGGSLTLQSTDNATKGKVYFGSAQTSVYDEVNDRIGIGTNAPGDKLTVSAGNIRVDGKLRLFDNSSNYNEINASGSDGSFVFSRNGTVIGFIGGAGVTRFAQILSPFSNNTYDLGDSNTKWKNLYIGTSAYINTNIGVGTTTPTARLQLPAGTAAANTASLKIPAGTLLTTVEAGAMEATSTHLYYSIGSTRYQLDQQAGQSSGQSTQNGNGSSTAFTITHGLTGITSASKVFITARSTAAVNPGRIDLSSTVITINYAVAPASGTGNLVWDWYIIP